MWLGDLLVPFRCPVCRGPGEGPCDACLVELPRPPALPAPPGIDVCVAVVSYRGAGRSLVADLKFGGRRGGVRWAALELAGELRRADERPTVVTWVPATPSHRRRRGIDQGEVLARAVARELQLPVRRLLRRREGPSQGAKGASARREGPPLRARGQVRGSVLVVDDVITTGGSLAAAARALREVGATRVVAGAVARTPP
jgi:predicted amidophosphoribosyltransferase